MSAKTSYFTFSPKSKKKRSISKIHPESQETIINNRERLDSLEEQNIHNTSILNFDGNMYSAKIVDVDERNIIQIIFKYNNQYNRWKCKLCLKDNATYDDKLGNIYLKSFFILLLSVYLLY